MLCSATRTLVNSGVVYERYESDPRQNPPALNLVLDGPGDIAQARSELCHGRGFLGRSSLIGTLLAERARAGG